MMIIMRVWSIFLVALLPVTMSFSCSMPEFFGSGGLFGVNGAIAQEANQEANEAEYATHSSLLLDSARTPAGNILVAGEHGQILLSKNAGQSWTLANTPVQVMLTGLYIQNENIAWAVGHDLTILQSSDGGLNWVVRHRTKENGIPLFDIWFKNEKQGIAVGSYGTVLRTQDGGVHWQAGMISEELDTHLNRILFTSKQKLIVPAELGYVFISEDFGETFEPVETGYDGPFFGASERRDVNVPLVIWGMRGHVFISDHQARDWRQVVNPSDNSYFGATPLSSGELLLVGGSASLAVLNQALSMEPRDWLPHRKTLTSVLEIDPNKLLVTGQMGLEWVRL